LSPISPEDWRRLEPLFDELLDLSPQLREPWLRNLPGLADEDRAQLKDLLRAHDDADAHLESPLPTAATRLMAESVVDPLVGQELGSYKVIEEIGRGGMGVVYLGKRTDGEFKQEVVIKVLRLGIDSEDTRRRFLQERQILADLDHPAIVRLLDGGFTGDGRPYIVMNRVVGQRIDTYCDRHRLDIRARVRLFLSVTEAVDCAHRHLIIHRDLKPGNVWVDEAGKVHLLDFGIAKILEKDGTPGMTVTQQRLMTPEYASPEQVRQEKITTASDVYQLGVLLYQLLTGQYPYDLAGRTPHEMEQRICETEPMAASRAVTSGGTSGAATSALNQASDHVFTSRNASALQLKNILRGDLDIILKKALRKEPLRRYLSARELREDLINWLSGDRIQARPDSLGYQIRRFGRRHPLGLSLLATIIVFGVGFTVFHVQRVTAERDIARLESQRRKEVSDFLVNLLKVPDPTTAQGREITARELLEVSFSHLDEDLSDPETKIRVLQVVGQVSKNLGLLDQTAPALEQVVTHSVELYGRRSLETAAAIAEVAELQRLAREPKDAIAPAEETLGIRRELLPAGDLLIGKALRLVALLHRDLREHVRAAVELREAVVIYEAQLPADDPVLLAIRVDLAYVLRTIDKGDEAEAIYRQAIPVMRMRSDEFQESLPSALNNLAYLLRKKEEFAEAEGLYREAIERNENFYGEAHPSTLLFRNNLAAVLQMQGKLEETRHQLTVCIEMQEHLNGADHWRTGAAHRSLGYFHYMSGDFDAAVPQMRAAVDNFANGLGPDHLWTAASAMQLATCLHMQGDKTAANRYWKQALPILDTDKARTDRKVQRTLDLMIEYLPPGNDPWQRRLTDLLANPD